MSGADRDFRVFEVVDATDEEAFYVQGLFVSLDFALAELDQSDPGDIPGFDCPGFEDFRRIEIRERRLGWVGRGKIAAVVEWTLGYNEIDDGLIWSRKVFRGEEANR